MKRTAYLTCAVLLFACIPQGTEGQQAEAVLQHIAEVHVNPGQVALFEAADEKRRDRLAAAGVSFVVRASATEALVYRFVTPVGDYEGLDRRVAEMNQVAPPASGDPNGSDAIDHVDTYLRWTAPDLGYAPESPRLMVADWHAIRRIRIYVKQGKVGEVAEVFREIRDLYQRNNISETHSVSVQALGADAPIIEVQVFGSSMTDIYEAGERIEASVGAELDAFRTRIGTLSRRVEIDNFVIRRDLGYQPEN